MVDAYGAIGLAGEPGEREVAPIGWTPPVRAPKEEPEPPPSPPSERKPRREEEDPEKVPYIVKDGVWEIATEEEVKKTPEEVTYSEEYIPSLPGPLPPKVVITPPKVVKPNIYPGQGEGGGDLYQDPVTGRRWTPSETIPTPTPAPVLPVFTLPPPKLEPVVEEAYGALGLLREPGEVEAAPLGWTPPRLSLVPGVEGIVTPPEPIVTKVKPPDIDIKTREGYEAYQELPGKEQFGVLVGEGLVPEGAKFVGGLDVDWSKSGLTPAEIAEREASMVALTGRPAEGWGYLTPEQIAERTAREAAAQADLERRQASLEVVQRRQAREYAEELAAYETQQAAYETQQSALAQLVGIPGVKTPEGYSLGAAFAAGRGADVYSALGLGLFTEEQVLGAQFGQIEVSGQARALEKLDPYKVTPGISDQLIYEELKRGVPISETVAKVGVLPGGYALPTALKEGVPVSTLRLAGFTPEQVKEAEIVAFAPPVIIGKKGEFVGFEAAGEYIKEIKAPGYVPTVEEYSALHPKMTAGGVISSYEKQYGEISKSTKPLGLEYYPGGASKWEYLQVPTSLRGGIEKEEYPTPPLSIEGFTGQFVAGLDRPAGVGAEWEEAMRAVAGKKYIETYGTGEYLKGVLPSVAAMATPPGRVFFPEVTIGEIKPLEWTIMGAQIALITAPKWMPPVWKGITKVPGFRRFAPVPKPGLVYPTVTEPYGLPGKPGATVRVSLPPQNGLGTVSPLAPRFYEVYPGPAYVPYTGAPVPSVGGIRAPSGLIPGSGMEIPIGPMGYLGPTVGGPSFPLGGPIVGLGPTAVAPTTTLPMAPEQIAKWFAPAPLITGVEPTALVGPSLAIVTTPLVVPTLGPSLATPTPTPGWAPSTIPGLVTPEPTIVPAPSLVAPAPVISPIVSPPTMPWEAPIPSVVTPVVIPEVTPLGELEVVPGVTPVVVVPTKVIPEVVPEAAVVEPLPELEEEPAVVPTIVPPVVEPGVYPEVAPEVEPLPEKEPEPPIVAPIVVPVVTPPAPLVVEPGVIPEVIPIEEPIPSVVPFPIVEPITEPVTIPELAPIPELVPTIAYEPSLITPPEVYPIFEPEPLTEPEPFIPTITPPPIISPPIIPPVEVIPPAEPPPPEEPALPIPPGFGWPSFGGGAAGGRRVPRGLFGKRGWIFPELVISFPEPFKLGRREVRLAKKRRIPYGARRIGVGTGTISARKLKVK